MSRSPGGVGSNQYQTRGSPSSETRAQASLSPDDVAWVFHPDHGEWADVGLGVWSEAEPWIAAGITPEESLEWRDTGLGAHTAVTVLREATITDRSITGDRFHRFLRRQFQKLPDGPRATVMGLRTLLPAEAAEALMMSAWMTHMHETHPGADMGYQRRMVSKASRTDSPSPEVEAWWDEYAPKPQLSWTKARDGTAPRLRP